MIRFRSSALALVVLAALTTYGPATQANPLATFDVNGEKGADGQDGASYHGSAGTGSDGRNGGNASEAKPGQDAGHINLDLKETTKGVVVLSGEVVHPAGNRAGIAQQIEFGQEGYIILQARGGDGGRGGRGGDGQDGGRGYDGSNATQFSSGGNGGNGGDGGDAGSGTSGKDAGRGGDIVVELPKDQTKLLMLVQHTESGGAGGLAGQHGSPGRGGSGGSGGSGYSWSESTTTTNSDGTTTTNTTYHSNPGGISGSSGSDGRSAMGSLANGRDGQNGRFKIRTIDKDGSVREFDSRYDLVLDGYNLVMDDNDGIFEPGEKIHVKNLKIRNTGGMPTPPNTAVRFYLTNSEFSVAEAVDILLTESIEPGGTRTIADRDLNFTIKNNILFKAGEERAHWDDSIRPLADLTEVNRPFTNFDHAEHINVTYPIEIEPIQTLRTLSPGEASRFFFRVKNISQRDYGSDSELHRAIQMMVKRSGGDLSPNGATFFTSDGKPLDLNHGILQAVSKLKAGESALLEGIVGMDPGAESARLAMIENHADLERIEEHGRLQTVQNRTLEVRVGQAYTHTAGSDLLLVTNTKTDRRAIAAWKKIAADYGLTADVWDLNYNAGLDLTQALQNGSTLMDDFKGKTLVFLDNDFSFLTDRSRATQFLTRRQFLDAVAERGINFLIAGPNDRTDLLRGFLLPTEGKESSHFKNIRDFMKAFRAGVTATETPQNSAADYSSVFSSIEVNRWSLWGKPKEQRLTDKNQRLQDRMRRLHPERNYIVVQNFEPAILRKGFLGIGKKWTYGSLEVRRTLDNTMGSGVTVDVPENDLNSGAFEKSGEAEFALLMTLSFDQKMQVFERLATQASPDRERLDRLSEALVSDLAFEQVAVRRAVDGGFVSGGKIREAMPKLRRFSQLKVKVSGEAENVFVKVAASIDFFSQAQNSVWDYLLPLRPNRQVDGVTRSLVRRAVHNAFDKPWHGAALIRESRAALRDKMKVSLKSRDKKTSKAEAKSIIANGLVLPKRDAKVGASQIAQAKLVGPRSRAQKSVVKDPTLNSAELKAQNKALADQRAEYLVPHPGLQTEGAAAAATVTAAGRCQDLFK